ncbi:hypothetical protein TW85_25190, partial [Marinomonas sp. S3726]|uniref:hypothetical protein n=1 Tax=Marinomonas sp. S3726 TaxID=579484 RepID=UPI0005FA1A15
VRADFPRFLDDGRGVDSNRALGDFQDYQTESHRHKTDGSDGGDRHAIDLNSDGIFDAGSSASSLDDAGYSSSSVTGAFGGLETRPRNSAFLGYIKY